MKDFLGTVAVVGFSVLLFLGLALDFGLTLTEGRLTIIALVGSATFCAVIGLIYTMTQEQRPAR